MGDIRFCLVLVITFMTGCSNRDDDLEKYLENYNEEFEQKENLRTEFNTVVDFITRCDFDAKSRVWKKADLFSLLVEIHRAIFKRKIYLNPASTGTALKGFYDAVDRVVDSGDSSNYPGIYYQAALQASNDRGSRLKRGEILQTILDSNYTLQIRIEPDA